MTDAPPVLATPKQVLQHYLQRSRESLLWKLDGLSDYDLRRPMTTTGTNLLGLVKHVASTEMEYLGLVFGRPSDEPMPWMADDAEDNADMWVTPDQSKDDVIALYHRSWAHADATVAALELDAVGEVPWWPPERRRATLHQILVHMIAETERHCGHADIVRETIDGSTGLRAANRNLPGGDEEWWTGYRDRVEQAAQQFTP